MEPERVLARVQGLGRGSLLGFTLVLTEQKIIGIDARKRTVRLWLGMVLGILTGLGLGILVIYSGLEPILFRIHPLLSFIGMFAILVSIIVGTLYLTPMILLKRINQAPYSTLQAFKKDIILIETRKPGRTTEKGYFTIRLFNGTSFTFWTIGPDMFQRVNGLLANFAPGQTRDLADTLPEYSALDLDRPNNRLLAVITGAVILIAIIGGITLGPDLAVGVLVTHGLYLLVYSAFRRARRCVRSEGKKGDTSPLS